MLSGLGLMMVLQFFVLISMAPVFSSTWQTSRPSLFRTSSISVSPFREAHHCPHFPMERCNRFERKAVHKIFEPACSASTRFEVGRIPWFAISNGDRCALVFRHFSQFWVHDPQHSQDRRSAFEYRLYEESSNAPWCEGMITRLGRRITVLLLTCL